MGCALAAWVNNLFQTAGFTHHGKILGEGELTHAKIQMSMQFLGSLCMVSIIAALVSSAFEVTKSKEGNPTEVYPFTLFTIEYFASTWLDSKIYPAQEIVLCLKSLID